MNAARKLPLLVSVPHAGLQVPPEAAPFCVLGERDIRMDGDEGAAEIYALEAEVECFVTTPVARAIIDVNRAVDDRRKDGVVKTHTCWDVPVYDPFPPEDVVETLLERYYRPYHRRLSELARSGVKLGIDCHTMAEFGPPVGPDPRVERPPICLSNGDGTCPDYWFSTLRECFEHAFAEFYVSVNAPFTGGFITRSHAAEMPWVQLEMSRVSFLSFAEKRERVLEALTDWCIDLA
jgi:formiminoglutamase